MTIIEAIKEVMRTQGAPMTAKAAYNEIVTRKLYEFHAQDPAHVVVMQIRRHTDGLDFPTAAPTKHFKLVDGNAFFPLDTPVRLPRRRTRPRRGAAGARNSKSLEASLRKLQDLHEQYVAQLKVRMIADIRRLSAADFEMFAKELLEVYGFEDTHVTRSSGDGGIDGYGKLSVGLAHLNVAFQCKRWTKGNIQRPEIDKFRGASQGDFEQGIFFATTSFSQGAIDASIKRGAIPIVLIDAEAIVGLMIDKRFGIQAESLVIPTYALDLALGGDSRQPIQAVGSGVLPEAGHIKKRAR